MSKSKDEFTHEPLSVVVIKYVAVRRNKNSERIKSLIFNRTYFD